MNNKTATIQYLLNEEGRKDSIDCTDISVSQPSSRKGTKTSRMMEAYDGFKGPWTVAAVKKHIGEELWEQLTGRQYGLVMSAVNRAYHVGKASMGAEVWDDSIVWIDCLKCGIDLDLIRKMKKDDTLIIK